jgi:hypothetical protein
MTNGKQLWVRTPDDRWAPVVVGAGEDPGLRSVNYWDGDQWLTPTWGKLIKNEKGQSSTELSSLQLRHDDLTFNQNGFNPNYDYLGNGQSEPFSPVNAAFNRLFYLWPRSSARRNPDWRVVSLLTKLPAISPSQGVGWSPNHKLPFWPIGVRTSKYQHTIAGAQMPEYTEDDTFIDDDEGALIVHDAKAYSDNPGNPFNNWVDERTYTYLDFQAIRARLKQNYAQRGADLVGQYTHIDDMQLRSVHLHGVKITMKVSLQCPTTVNTQEIANLVQFNVYERRFMQGMGPSSYTNPRWNLTSQLHEYGTDMVSASNLQYQIGGDMQLVNMTMHPGGYIWDHQYEQTWTATGVAGFVGFESFPESGMGINCRAAAQWSAYPPPPVIRSYWDCTMTVDRITLVYAKPGTTVPPEAGSTYLR